MSNYLILLQIDKTDYYPVMSVIVKASDFSGAEKLAIKQYSKFKILQISIYN